MSEIPGDLKYTKEHEWVESLSEKSVRFGITDYAQSALGDIVYIQLPAVGDLLVAGKVCGEVESTKSVSEIYAPISGTVVRINEPLNQQPEILNRTPYGEGWLAEVEISGSGDLLSPEEYRTFIGE